MTDEEILYERLSRAIAHATATFARANRSVESRTVVAALMTNLISVASMIGDKEQLLDAISQAWDSDARQVSRARQAAADDDESKSRQALTRTGQPLVLLKPLR